MKQLGILDSAFINLEQANTPQHIGGLGIYDPSTAPGGLVRFKQVIATFEQRLGEQSLFRTRVVEVPGGVDRPYWVKDADFDVEFHMRHIALPEPGDWRQLCIQIARLHSRPLDMSKPLWEAYIIEGLDNIPNLPKGCFAVYTKIHHAMIDGTGGSSFMELIHDITANPEPRNSDNHLPRLVDSQPSVPELLTKASINGVKNTVGLVRSTFNNGRALADYALRISRKEISAPDLSAPKTILNKPVGPHRVFDAAEFPLDGFKDIKNAAAVKLNDVALAIIGGALQSYLESKGEAPAGSLAASMPLNMRTRRGSTDEHNQVGAIFASLHSSEKDPMARLAAVHQSTLEAKIDGEASPLVDVLKIAGAFSPVICKSVARVWSRNNLSQYIPLNVSTVVSNVPGPNFPLYCAGARMVDYYGLGVLTPGMGIFHLVFSYAGKLSISVLADRDIMPDPELYQDCLVASYEELYAAATAQVKPAKKRRSRSVKAKVKSPKRKPMGKAKPKHVAASDARATAKPSAKAKPKKASRPRKSANAGSAKQKTAN